MSATRITLSFPESETKWLEGILEKHYGRKPKTKKDFKKMLEMFVGSMFNIGAEAVAYGDKYINIK